MTKYQTGEEKKHWQYLKKRAGVCEKRSHVRRVRCWAKLSPAPLLFHSCKMGRSSHLVPHGHRRIQRTEWSQSVTKVFAHYLYFAIIFILGPQSPPTSVCCHIYYLLRNAHCRKWLSGQGNKKKVSSRRRLRNSGTWDTWSKSFIQICFSLLIAGWQDRFLIIAICLSSQLSIE